MRYNWQQPDWPEFRFDASALEESLYQVRENAGRIAGAMGALAESERNDTLTDLLVVEALKTSEIEGERLHVEHVVSSIRMHLGLQDPGDETIDARAQGAAELILAVRRTLQTTLTEEMILDWHTTLMRGYRNTARGVWRTHDEPMQIVSRAERVRPRVHFEAPPSNRVPAEMQKFIVWFNTTGPGAASEIKSAAIRSAIAHLYFESIHPFEDGNGRIGRAVAEKALSESLGYPSLVLLSRSIESERRDYYRALERAQRSNEISDWVKYFVHLILKAQVETERTIAFVIQKARFLQRHRNVLSERQLKVVQRMLESGSVGFVGGMTARKYGSITKVSKATATRDLSELAKLEVLRLVGAGRSVRYELNLRE